jgi:DNA transformation protein
MSDDFVAHIMDLLSGWGGVSVKRMFSGHGLHRQGVMFGLIIRDTLYFKTDDRNRPAYEAAGLQPFSFHRRGKDVSTSYWEAPPESFDDAGDMRRWAMDALDAALARKSAKAAKTAKKKPRATTKRRKITKN